MKKKLVGVFAVKHKDEKVVEESRSGGIFTAISDYILDNNGVVYGCVLDEDFMAVHARAEDKETRDLMRGSKYIQSKLGDCFLLVLNDLKNGRKVLFTGTSCQVAALRKFLGDGFDNLFCIDILCHGVSSPKAWKAYLKWIEKTNHSKIESVEFRNKKMFGWHDHKETFYLQNGETVHTEAYRNLYLGEAILRPACYECAYKSLFHPGDLTIADYWGIEKVAPEFDDNKGVSLVLINTEKGMKCFDAVKDNVNFKGTDVKLSMQPALKEPSRRPANRDSVWKGINNIGMWYVARRYGEYGRLANVKSFVKGMIRR